MAKKSLGQHFLRDQSIIAWIIEKIPENLDFLVEVGPGKGALTKHLPKENTYLFELDDELIPFWRGQEFEVIVGDAVKTIPETIPSLIKKHGTNFCVVSNLPYNAAAPIFIELIKLNVPELVLMLQREVADKITAKFGEREVGRLTLMANVFYEVKGSKVAKPEAFSPPPKVHSKVVHLKLREKPLIEVSDFSKLELTVKKLFQFPRKKIRATGVNIPVLEDKRPHELQMNEWIEILQKELN